MYSYGYIQCLCRIIGQMSAYYIHSNMGQKTGRLCPLSSADWPNTEGKNPVINIILNVDPF